MAWNLYNARDSFDQYLIEWDKLNQKLYNTHPMLDSSFVKPLITNFSDKNTVLAIYTEKENYQNMLLIENNKIYSWISFLPGQAQIGISLISNNGALKKLINTLGLNILSFDLLCQDPDYSFYLNFNDVIASKHTKTFKISLKGTFDDYWKQRSKNLQKNIRRYNNKINTDFEKVEFKIISDTNQLYDAISRYGTLESSGWKAKLGTAIHPQNQQGLFYSKVINNFSKKNNARVFELYFNDQLAASRITISNDTMFIILKTTYMEQYKKYAPGRILLYKILKNEFQSKKFKEIEFYTNATEEQLSWSTSSRYIQHYTYYRNNVVHIIFNYINYLKTILSRVT